MTTSLPLDHSGLGVLPRKECLQRLAKARLGRVAFVSQGDPVILPVNHGMDGENIIFRTATGTKLLAADTEQVVAFEVDGYDADRRTGWSVMVRGVATHRGGPGGGQAAEPARRLAVGRSGRTDPLGTDQHAVDDRTAGRASLSGRDLLSAQRVRVGWRRHHRRRPQALSARWVGDR